jgi:hypothetical protein
MVRTSSSPYKRMPPIGVLSLRIPIRHPTLVDLNLPLATLIGITGKRKQLLTCTQDTTRASLSDYPQQDLSMMIKRLPLDMQWL